MEILGIDIGGTSIKAAVVDSCSGVLVGDRIRLNTPCPSTPEAVADVLKVIVEQCDYSGPIGIGFPAVIQHGISRTASNVDSRFIDWPITDFFSERLKQAVYVANDADVAGLAEMRFGAGRDNDGVVLIVTIGTGLGTAVFNQGCLLPNTELGHIYLENGLDAERYASEAVRITEALTWEAWGKRLNLYLKEMEKLLWPDLIILGGGVSEELHRFSSSLTTAAPVVAANYLNQAGIVGAALFANESMKTKGNFPKT